MINMPEELRALDELRKQSTPGDWFFESHFDPQVEILVSGAVEDASDPSLHAAVLLHGGELPDKEVEANWEYLLALHEAFPKMRDALLHYAEENERLRKIVAAKEIGQ